MEDEDRSLLRARVQGLVSVFPFNEYEYVIMFLTDRGVLSFREYEDLRENYVSDNRYLELFELAPRSFGQTWGERHILDLDTEFQKPNRTADPNYDGEYDLLIDNLRIEVKSSRAYNASLTGSLVSRALTWESDSPFWMNYQQLKLDICDVFIFIGVWVNRIVYWVMSNNEVKNNRYLSPQHRDGIEYQIGMRQNNIQDFNLYRVEASDIATVVRQKGNESTTDG
jgi:hypothetical protein